MVEQPVTYWADNHNCYRRKYCSRLSYQSKFAVSGCPPVAPVYPPEWVTQVDTVFRLR